MLEDNSWKINTSEDKSRWVCCNPDLKTELIEFPRLADMFKLHVVVKEGEMLYLPSLWYHQVAQSHKNPAEYIIAVNNWFDMDFTQNHTLYELTRIMAGFPK